LNEKIWKNIWKILIKTLIFQLLLFQYLKNEYLDKGRSINSISSELGVSDSTIKLIFKKNGIKIRNHREQIEMTLKTQLTLPKSSLV
jgi:YbbR domain-containing protein